MLHTLTSHADPMYARGHRIAPFAETADADTDWPTTERFSRRLGEALPGADYASAVEAPPEGGQAPAMLAMLLIASFALLFVLVLTLWPAR